MAAGDEERITPRLWYQFRDLFTRVDDLLEANLKTNRELIAVLKELKPVPTVPVPGVPPPEAVPTLVSFDELLAAVKAVATDMGMRKDYFSYSGNVTSTTPIERNVLKDLERPSRRGFFTNDDPADAITIRINDRDPITVLAGEVYNLAFHIVEKIYVETAVATATPYRCLVI